MDVDSGDLVLTEVKWIEKPGNGWLLREVFGLLLRDPDDLTDSPTPPTMLVEGVADKGRGER